MSYYPFPKYVSVGEKKAKADRKRKQLQKTHKNLKPIILPGTALAATWWGKAWNRNLEQYADYTNRIGRGRSYVRHGAVLHLDITPGRVDALVLGSSSSPYNVSIAITPISEKKRQAIISACKGKLGSLQALVKGKFPKDLARIFTEKEDGLFPSPEEISFDCSCPDWASMCKHVAAVLYGVGARLDQDPTLFFVLRELDHHDLVSEAVAESKNDLLHKATRKSKRVLDDDTALSDLFGIDIDMNDTPPAPPKKRAKKTAPLKKAAVPKKKTAKAKSTPAKKPRVSARGKKKAVSAPLTPAQIMDQVERVVRKGKKKGVTVSDIVEQTGQDITKIRNSIARLRQAGTIESIVRGLYCATPKTKKKKKRS